MKRFLIEMSNGYCGCDETYILTSEGDFLDEFQLWDWALETYSYTDGFVGDENLEEEAEEEGLSLQEYLENLLFENSNITEISEDEYANLIEEGIEESG